MPYLTQPPHVPLRAGAVTVRPWHERDVPAVIEAGRDVDILRLVSVWPDGDDAAARLFIEQEQAATRQGGRLSLAIATAPESTAIGGILLHRLVPGRGQAEIAYWLLNSARGRGLATGAVRLLTGFAFEELELRRIELLVESSNAASIRVAERAGFRREPELRERRDNTGMSMKLAVFALYATNHFREER